MVHRAHLLDVRVRVHHPGLHRRHLHVLYAGLVKYLLLLDAGLQSRVAIVERVDLSPDVESLGLDSNRYLNYSFAGIYVRERIKGL